MTLKSLNFTLLVVNLDSEDLTELAEQLNKKQMMTPEFFADTPMVVNISKAQLEIDFAKLKETVAQSGFILSGITGEVSASQKQQAAEHCIALLHSSQRVTAASKNVEQSEKTEIDKAAEQPVQADYSLKPKMHIGRVRSGQQIYAKECDLVISGDVGAGAEVIADGNIHIYGALRGRALAGAVGNKNAAIFCQSLQPELVSIAGVYKISDMLPKDKWATACSIFLEDQTLVFSSLNKV